MDFNCKSCNNKIRVPDNKLPPGKTVSVKCPRCSNKNSISVPEPSAPPAPSNNELGFSSTGDTVAAAFGFEEISSETYDSSEIYDSSEKAFDFIEEEGKTAMICDSDVITIEKLKQDLQRMQHHIAIPESARDAMRRMRYQMYNVIVVNENYFTNDPDTNTILIYLERLNMSVRRNMFVVMLTRRFRTRDKMIAFHRSVNLVINMKDLNDFKELLSRGITANELFYRVYSEEKRKIGVA